MANWLDEVLQRTRQRLEAHKIGAARPSSAQPSRRAKCLFSQAIRSPEGVAVIAEVKQASPSAGVIRFEDNLAQRIQDYVGGGAAALSILTEEEYFHGSPHLLEFARAQTDLPLL